MYRTYENNLLPLEQLSLEARSTEKWAWPCRSGRMDVG